MDERTTALGVVDVRWLEEGAGIPVVFLHGIPTGPELWRHVVPAVAPARRIAWEMPGYGRSASVGVDLDISVAAQAGYLLDWREAAAVGPAVFVGHDLGGGVAQIAAVRRPGACAGLVLTNSIGYDSWPIPSVKAMQMLSGVVGRMPRPVFRAVFTSFIRRGHDSRARAAESLATHWAPYDKGDGAAAFARQIRSLRTEDTLAVAPGLPELRLPARVVWGAADRFQKATYGARLARDLRARFEPIEGARHFTPEDHPDRVATAVNDLIGEIAGAGGS